MKYALAALLFLCSLNAFAKKIATCGEYTLNQHRFTAYFAGMAHEADGYNLERPDGSYIFLHILLNSGGADFTATDEEIDARISARMGKLTLKIDGSTIPCQVLNPEFPE